MIDNKTVEQLEREFAECLGVKHCLLLDSRSFANFSAFMALTAELFGAQRIFPGDEVIVMGDKLEDALQCIDQLGAKAVNLEVSEIQKGVEREGLENVLSMNTKAVVVGHAHKDAVDLQSVREFCVEYDLWLIEENGYILDAETVIEGKEKPVITIGDIGTFTFAFKEQELGLVYTNNGLLNGCICSCVQEHQD